MNNLKFFNSYLSNRIIWSKSELMQFIHLGKYIRPISIDFSIDKLRNQSVSQAIEYITRSRNWYGRVRIYTAGSPYPNCTFLTPISSTRISCVCAFLLFNTHYPLWLGGQWVQVSLWYIWWNLMQVERFHLSQRSLTLITHHHHWCHRLIIGSLFTV